VRLAVPVAVSLTAHLLLAWGLDVGLDGGGVGIGSAVAANSVRANLERGDALAQAPASPATENSSRPTAQGARAGRAATDYLPASKLDTRPQVMTRVAPEYPAELVAGIRGKLVLELYVSADGTLDRIRVAQSNLPGPFEASALKAFRGARYAPGMKRGKPVPSLLRIEVNYN